MSNNQKGAKPGTIRKNKLFAGTVKRCKIYEKQTR